MKPCAPDPVKLFVGILFTNVTALDRSIEMLTAALGRVDYKSPEFEFIVSEYYREEMGWPLFRKFISHYPLIDPAEIADIKLQTNDIESQMAKAGKRRINLDPGYLDYNKVILASAKQNAQKIYLGRGIYADPTLWYENGRFEPYAFSFPDFKSNEYHKTFLHIRALYKGQLRKSAREK